MKNQILLFSLLFIFAQADAQKLKRYDIKTGIVEYEITISGKVLVSSIEGSGTESLYFKDWGAVEVQKQNSSQTTVSKIFGKVTKETTDTHTLVKLDNGESYEVDFDHKTIHVRRDMAMDMMQQTNTDAGETGKNMLESIGGQMTGYEQFMGYKCETWEIPGGKQWLYKGVPLKIDMTIMGIRTLKVATKAIFNKNVKEEYFRLPDFKMVKEQGYQDNEAFSEDMDDTRQRMDEMSKMSFEEWKAQMNQDPEFKEMPEEEKRQSYELMKAMAKKLNGM